MDERRDVMWQSAEVAHKFLKGVRGAVPLAAEQIAVLIRLLKNCGPVERILDLGCGDGVLGAALLEHFPRARCIFADFSEPMLVAARERLAGTRYEVEFMRIDYAEARWLDVLAQAAPFDAVISGYSIHHQPDERKRELYAEIKGLLRSGGVFVNMEHVASRSRWGEEMFENLLIECLWNFAQKSGTSKTRDEVAKEYYTRPDQTANKLSDVELQCEWLREIGYTNVDCYFKLFELAVFGGRA